MQTRVYIMDNNNKIKGCMCSYKINAWKANFILTMVVDIHIAS